MTYGLDDVGLIPARITRVTSRSECNPLTEDGKYPLFTAPMNSVINENNYLRFQEQGINTIIPTGVDLTIRYSLITKTFIALNLQEFEQWLKKDILCKQSEHFYICVDVANGHMQKLINLCTEAKSKYGNSLVLMTGNIANPETYIDYAKAGIDYVRLSIGSGNCCSTSSFTGHHMGIASLIIETVKIKNSIIKAIDESIKVGIIPVYNSIPAIIADGGFSNYGRIIKALALGADYVMVGKLFAQCEEACGEWIYRPEISEGIHFRVYYGMSTERAQQEAHKVHLKASEGIEITAPIIYTLKEWISKFKAYLQSSMSYANAFTLSEFSKCNYTFVSVNEQQNYINKDKYGFTRI